MAKSPNMKHSLLLVVRIVIGAIFVYEGWAKVSDMAHTVGFFASLGIPTFLAYVVAYVELVGGALLIVGFWSCVTAIALAIVMVGAVYFTQANGITSFGFPLAILAALLSLVASGSGKYSLGGCPCCKEE